MDMKGLLERLESIYEGKTRRTDPKDARPMHSRESKPARKSTGRKSRHKAKAALKKGDFDAASDKQRGTQGRLTH